MPYRIWRHFCQGRDVLIPSPDCSVCGAHGAFEGWRLSVREAASLYRYVYALEPCSSHRPLADRLLAPMRTPCVRCQGNAVLTIDVKTWGACPTCEGTGGVWNRPVEEVEAVRREILATPLAPRPAPTPQRDPPRETPRLRRRGHSSHGLRFAEVERAFAEAERLLGTQWQLKGRGHCRRATLDARYSSYAITGAARSWGRVRPHQAVSWKRLLPVAIIEKASEILGVAPSLLMCREY
jgi:hypothetical protein